MNARLLALLLGVGCGAKDDAGSPPTDTDTDTDTDSDTDADTDTVTDSDTDTDAPTFTFSPADPSTYLRVDRMGLPGVNTAVITSKDQYNAANPIDDVAGVFAGEITSNLEDLHQALDDDLTAISYFPCAVAVCLAQAGPLVLPDAIAIDTTLGPGFPNGRRLDDPAVDLLLAAVLLDLSIEPLTAFAGIPLNPPANDVPTLAAFPYLAPAH